MRRLFASLFSLALLTASPAWAVMEDYPSVKLQGLDKSVGRTVTFEATVGSTIQYGPLFIKIHACRKAPPIETPESAAFLQIWEVPPGQEKSEWVFSGWMFASSPALSAMDHPVYDVWVLDCLGREEPNEEAQKAETTEEADQTGLTQTAPDGEAATPAVDSEAEEPIPTDSEAEEPEPQVQPESATDPAISPEPIVPQYENGAEPPTPQAQHDATMEEDGLTAYDFMKQQSGKASSQQQEAPPATPQQPIY